MKICENVCYLMKFNNYIETLTDEYIKASKSFSKVTNKIINGQYPSIRGAKIALTRVTNKYILAASTLIKSILLIRESLCKSLTISALFGINKSIMSNLI